MDGQMPSGGDTASKIRLAAQQALNPQELQIVAQAITPQFVQVMAKLFGDQAVMLLGPLVNIQQTPLQQQSQQPQGNPLQNFMAPAAANYGMANEAEGPTDTQQETGEEDVCQGCQDPNCPDCQMARRAPSGVRYGR